MSLKAPICNYDRAVIGGATLIEFRKGKLGERENTVNTFPSLCTGPSFSGLFFVSKT